MISSATPISQSLSMCNDVATPTRLATQISPKLAASYSDGLKVQSCEQDRE